MPGPFQRGADFNAGHRAGAPTFTGSKEMVPARGFEPPARALRISASLRRLA